MFLAFGTKEIKDFTISHSNSSADALKFLTFGPSFWKTVNVNMLYRVTRQVLDNWVTFQSSQKVRWSWVRFQVKNHLTQLHLTSYELWNNVQNLLGHPVVGSRGICFHKWNARSTSSIAVSDDVKQKWGEWVIFLALLHNIDDRRVSYH